MLPPDLQAVADSLRPTPKADGPGRIYSVRLTDRQAEAIDEIAKADGLRPSDLLRLALAEFVAAWAAARAA